MLQSVGIEPTLLRTCALSMRLNHSAKTAFLEPAIVIQYEKSFCAIFFIRAHISSCSDFLHMSARGLVVMIVACQVMDPGSIPGERKFFFFFFFSVLLVFFANNCTFRMFESVKTLTSAYSSVGRAGDCSGMPLISLGRWFDSGCAEFFKFFFFSYSS